MRSGAVTALRERALIGAQQAGHLLMSMPKVFFKSIFRFSRTGFPDPSDEATKPLDQGLNDDLGAMFAMRRQHAKIAAHMNVGRRNQCSDFFYQLVLAQNDAIGAVIPRLFEFINDIPIRTRFIPQ